MKLFSPGPQEPYDSLNYASTILLKRITRNVIRPYMKLFSSGPMEPYDLLNYASAILLKHITRSVIRPI